jgi:AcrR family transcriptional regulator
VREDVTLVDAEARRSQQRTDARRAILGATEAILVEEGYEQFSMRKLAGRCGYTAPTIYHYFGDKTRLLDTLLELHMADLVAELRRVPTSPDPTENMRALFIAFASWGLASPTHYQLLTTVRSPDSRPIPSGELAREILEQPMNALAARKRLRTDLETAKQSFWVLLHGIVSLRHTRPDVEWKEALMESALDSMIRGAVLPERS